MFTPLNFYPVKSESHLIRAVGPFNRGSLRSALCSMLFALSALPYALCALHHALLDKLDHLCRKITNFQKTLK